MSDIWDVDYLEETSSNKTDKVSKGNFASHGIPIAFISSNGPLSSNEPLIRIH